MVCLKLISLKLWAKTVFSVNKQGEIFKNLCHKRQRLDVVYSDVCGPMQAETPGGSKYFVLFINDWTRKTWTYLIKQKSGVLGVFKRFEAMVERLCDKKIKLPRTGG